MKKVFKDPPPLPEMGPARDALRESLGGIDVALLKIEGALIEFRDKLERARLDVGDALLKMAEARLQIEARAEDLCQATEGVDGSRRCVGCLKLFMPKRKDQFRCKSSCGRRGGLGVDRES